MKKIQYFLRQPRSLLIAMALVSLLAGLVYYLIFRVQGLAVASYWPGLLEHRRNMVDPTGGSLPAFIHMVFLGFTTTALLGIRKGVKLTAGLFVITVIAECFIGTFDWADLFMALLGCLLSLQLSVKIYDIAALNGYNSAAGQPLSRSVTAGLSASLVAGTAVLIGASYYPCMYCGDEYQSRSATPVYLSYGELRSAVAVESPRSIDDIGRIYLYSNFIFLNKRNQGIHVLDNSDPANPQNIGFIAIPGNTELSIRSNYLYADSYVDLVTLDLNDPDNIYVSNRQTDIFPWDEYQNVTDDVYFDYGELDQNRGVVVSYELK